LYLPNNRLTGEIPSEIGNLTSLFSLDVSYNELLGEIPEEICNPEVSSLSLLNNQFCPPYPSCIQYDVGNQNISECPGIVSDIDGNYYEIVQIGDQLWMAENLKVTHYKDGTEIPTGYSDNDWTNLSISISVG
jgi:hypothetical protein